MLSNAAMNVVPHDHLDGPGHFFAIDGAGRLAALEDTIGVLVAEHGTELALLCIGPDHAVRIEFDVVDIEEDVERGASAHRGTRVRVPVDHAVVVAVDAGAGEVGVEEAAVGIALFGIAGDLDPFAADVEAIGHVPVVSDLRVGRIGSRTALARVDDQSETEHDDQCNDHREQRAALEANFLTLALLREPGGFLGG